MMREIEFSARNIPGQILVSENTNVGIQIGWSNHSLLSSLPSTESESNPAWVFVFFKLFELPAFVEKSFGPKFEWHGVCFGIVKD